MAEAKYEWQTIHKSKADALKALEEHREGVENGLRMPTFLEMKIHKYRILLIKQKLEMILKKIYAQKCMLLIQTHLKDQ